MIVTFLKITRNTASDSFKNLPVRKYLNRIFYLLLGVLMLVQSNPCYILDSIRYSNTFTHMEDLFKGNNTHAFSLRSEHTLFSAVCYICVKVKALSEPSNYRCSTSFLSHPNFLKEWSLPVSSISSALTPCITLGNLTSFPTIPLKLLFQRFQTLTVKANPIALSLSS